MRRLRSVVAAVSSAALVTVGVIAGTSAVADAHDRAPRHPWPPPHSKVTVTPLATGLTASKAVANGPSGSVLYGVQTADGNGALMARLPFWGQPVQLASLPASPSDIAMARHGDVWVLFGKAESEEGGPPPTQGQIQVQQKLYLVSSSTGTMRLVADLGAYAAQHPDPTDLENDPADSNPYGLASLRDGSVLVADAGANSVRRVWPNGHIQQVAHLPNATLATPPGQGLPPTLPAEAVPTSVAVGPDGAWYVGQLNGFPFTPGAADVFRIRPGMHDATCSLTARHGACTVYAKGFTSIMDIAFDHRGSMYVLEFAKDGVGAVESDPTAPPPPAVLLKVRQNHRTELGAGKMFLPGGVVAAPRSDTLYVTDWQLAPGQGRLLKVSQ